MKRNTIILLAALSFVSYSAYGQDENLLWPLKGKDAGENILYRPQEYVGSELNFDNLFIGGAFGDTVVAPADGIITDYCIH